MAGLLSGEAEELTRPYFGKRAARPLDPPRPVVGRAIPPLGEPRDFDDVARMRRVDEAPVAGVDAHMTKAVEEDEVSRLQPVARDKPPAPVLHPARVGELDAE